MRAGFTIFDELLIERVFQPLCNILAIRFGVARTAAAASYLTWQQSNSFNVRSLSINGPMLMVNFTF